MLTINEYIAWGDPSSNIVNDNLYAFITATGEFIGMFIFMFFLIGVLLNLKMTKSFAYMKNPFGWIVFGISLGLMCGLFASYGFETLVLEKYGSVVDNTYTSHLVYLNLNPAFVITGMLKGINQSDGYIPVGNGFLTLIFQFIGAFLASILAYLFFRRLILQQEDVKTIRGCFYTSPSYNNKLINLFNEFLATFIFAVIIFLLGPAFFENQMAIKILIISLVVGAMGYGIGGVTGYALNPFRDLCPRIVYTLLMKHRDKDWKQDWSYSIVPIIGPICGALLALLVTPGFLY